LTDLHTGALFGLLVFLIVLSAFFSASETSMVALNRYRLRHLVEKGHRGARMAARLLERPDRLLGVILLGNNIANLSAASVATVLALQLYGEAAIAVATMLLTVAVLLFAEVAPKTMAAVHPERVAFPAAYVLSPLLAVLYPVVWIINSVANVGLRMFGVSLERRREALSAEELRTVVLEAGSRIPAQYQSMLLGILDLEKVSVDDIMVPRSYIEAIDLDEDWDDIVDQLATAHHTRLPLYRGSLDHVVGIVHMRQVLQLSQSSDFNREGLDRIIQEPYFIPEGAPLTRQLYDMRMTRQRMGMVVDEYGDIRGLVTLEEILEEIVGEFTTTAPGMAEDVIAEDEGTYIVDAAASIRDLNRKMGWNLPADGPKTLNGLILEYLEDIPEPGTSLRLAGYPIEILQTTGAAVKTVRVDPRRQEPAAD